MSNLRTPSYSQGFARSAAESANPGSWKELVWVGAPFLGPTGLTLFDWGGRKDHGTLTTMVPATDWVPSPYGWALDFGTIGEDKHVAMSGLSNVSGNTTTLSVLARLDTEDVEGVVLFGTTTGSTVYWQIQKAASDTVYIHSQAISTPTDGYWDGVWRWYTFVSDGANVLFYVNGNLVASAVAVGTSLAAGSKDFQLGKWVSGSNWNLEGAIAEVVFHDRALAASEIEELYTDPDAHALLQLRQRTVAVAPAAGVNAPTGHLYGPLVGPLAGAI